MTKRRRILSLMTVCFVSAALTLMILGFAARSARLRVADQFALPDYIRYLSQGYAFDVVSSKHSLLVTVTDGELPVRVHILTVDEDRKTLDILDIPPDSYIIADGYSGTVRDAFSTTVYRQIVSHVLALKIDGSVSFDAKTFGDACEMLGVVMKLPKGVASPKPGKREIVLDSETAEKIALDCYSYSGGDEAAVKLYRAALASLLSELCERGSLDSFSTLMNLIVNRVDADIKIEEMIELVNSARGITPKKMNIRIIPGSPAKFGEQVIWSLDREKTAALLNSHFRVKGVEIPPTELSIPAVTAGEFIYENLPERVDDIAE